MLKNILLKPLVTEKITKLQEDPKTNIVGFIVNLNANKIQIKQAVEAKYSVNVENVRTMRYDGKTKTQFTRRGRFTGKTKRFKKAIVTLKEGQKIDFFENI